MIRKINENDFIKVQKLGLEYDKDFFKHYDLNIYNNNDIYNIIVYENNGILGFTIYTKIDFQVEIELIYVDKLFRNQKVASSMINYLEHDCKEILLEVSVENIPAKNLYEKLGFIKIGERKGYYHGIDAMVMKKVIK